MIQYLKEHTLIIQ